MCQLVNIFMSKIDSTWITSKDRIVIDEDLDIDRLGWKGGDYFKLVNINGVPQLVKVDPLIKFLIQKSA